MKQAIPNANIYVTGLDSTGIEAYDYTDQKGRFSLRVQQGRPYLLYASSLGYKKQIIKLLAISTPDTLVQTVILQQKPLQLEEFTVTGQRQAIISKEDTVIFNVESFTRGNEKNVEDILKALPGITVKDNGQITANGQTISKVLLGDDDLFGSNYQMLTRNLSAEVIKDVSIYEHYNENEALREVSRSNETVLNLSLKEDAKQQFFATISGYYDLDKNYKANGNAISISKNLKAYLFENANNVGTDPIGNIYMLVNPDILSQSTEEKLGTGVGSSGFVNPSQQRVPELNQNRYLLNQTSLHTLGAVYKPVTKLEVKGLGHFLLDKRQVDMRSITRYDPELEVQNLMEQQNTRKNISTALGKLTAKYTFSKKANINYEGTFLTFPETNRTQRLINEDSLQTRLRNRTREWDNKLEFTRRLAEKQTYRLRIRYKTETNDQRFLINPFLRGGPFPADSSASVLTQQGNNEVSYLGSDLKYWKKGEDYSWSIRLGGERNSNSMDNRITGVPSFTNANYWNRYKAYSSLSFRKTFNNLEAYATLTGNFVRNVTNVQTQVDDFNIFLSPETGLQYDFGKNKKQYASVTYALNYDQPDLKNIYGGQYLTGYRDILQGSSNYVLLPSNIFTAIYRYGAWEDNFVMNAFFRYDQSNTSYTQQFTITPTYNTATYILNGDRQSLNTGISIDEFVPFLQSNVNFQYNLSRNSYTSFFNQTANSIRSRTHHFEVSVRTAFVGNFNATTGVESNLTQTSNETVDIIRKRRYLASFLNINIDVGKKFSTTLEYKFYTIKGAGTFNFADAQFEYEFVKNKFSLFLNASNILDETAFRTIYQGSYSEYQQRNRLNPRFVMIGANLSFR